jgi:hypothetical protein
MSGLPDFNFPAFFDAEERFASAGWLVVNPARMDVDVDGFDPTKSRAESHAHYMRRDLPEVARCDAIALLPGWEGSLGVKDELYVALACGLAVLDATTMAPVPAESPLSEAHRIVHSDRGAAYGPPDQDFARTGRMWGAILGTPDVPPRMVALCMIALKASREAYQHKRDSLVDIAGYVETLSMIEGEL